MTYYEMLKDPRWQKRRLEIMQRDSFMCCNCSRPDRTLTVHHKIYLTKLPLWEYDDLYLQTLCEPCHKEREDFLKTLLCVFQNNGITTAEADQILRLCVAGGKKLTRVGFINALQSLAGE